MDVHEDVFCRRVRALAVAGWWTTLIVAIWLTVVWLLWLVLMNARPDWVLRLWGGRDLLTWEEVQRLVLVFFAVMKLFVWIWIAGTVCLTIWARRLKRTA